MLLLAELPRVPRGPVPRHERVCDVRERAHVARQPRPPRAQHIVAPRRQQRYTGKRDLVILVSCLCG